MNLLIKVLLQTNLLKTQITEFKSVLDLFGEGFVRFKLGYATVKSFVDVVGCPFSLKTI